MSVIITERAGGILRVELNRSAQKNAMTSCGVGRDISDVAFSAGHIGSP